MNFEAAHLQGFLDECFPAQTNALYAPPALSDVGEGPRDLGQLTQLLPLKVGAVRLFGFAVVVDLADVEPVLFH